MRYAFSNNNERKSMELSYQSLETTYEQSKQQRLPNVSASVGQNFSNNANGWSTSGNVGVGSSVTIFQGGNINNTIEQNRLNVERNGVQLERYDNQLAVQILQSFLSILGNQEKLNYQQKVLNTSREQVKQGRARYNVGSILESDLLLLEAQYLSDSNNILDTRINIDQNLLDMKVLLSHLFKLAIKKEIVSQNKTEYVDIPFDLPKAKRECWTQAEIAALWLEYQKNPFAGYILIMCYAGLRYGELATIQLENIHLDENYMIGGIKTDAGINREIPIHEKLKPIISQIVARSKHKLLEMNEDRFYEKYWETIRHAGMRELPPHTCRHYFFSRMTSAGVQGGIIAEVGGHANYLTTLKNYVRVPLDDKLKAVNSI